MRDAQGNPLAVYDNNGGSVTWREQQLYGSSRLGIWQPNVIVASGDPQVPWLTTGNRQYELSNHLGNVMVTLSDKRVQYTSNNSTLDYFLPDVTTAQDYYAFGSLQPARTFAANGNYRYGFNGKENDNDVGKGTGNQQDYGMRIYDPRVGRFLSVDPITDNYPELTPYQFASNSPILNVDMDGLEASNSNSKKALIGVPLVGPTTAHIVEQQVVKETVKKTFWQGVVELGPVLGKVFGTVAGVVWPVPNDPNSSEAVWMRQRASTNAMVNHLEYHTSDPSTLSDQYLVQVRERIATGRAYASDYKYAKEANSRFGGQSQSDVKEGQGVVYLRIDKTGGLKPYIGQAKSLKRYKERQREHSDANPDAVFEFTIINFGNPGDDLNRKEQQGINALGGVSTKKNNYSGGTSNQRNPDPKTKTDNGN